MASQLTALNTTRRTAAAFELIGNGLRGWHLAVPAPILRLSLIVRILTNQLNLNIKKG
jgi:hypothetical protein